ncbi:MAG: hypothetical protein DI556_11685 [Rhodovulum sulfidophilum]|uniref:Uncharacterized protein n=1 Tax=Rhodovulum sulfidophilum TaxID=35806 RepID=A0A2W5NEK0_RHOSU|nr:MAG: hypothetical protein DI556_11685 [Rhodovulum sulfidophilum]
MRPTLFLLALLAPLAAAAQDPVPAGGVAEAEDIPVAEWIAMAGGRTLTYQINGAFFALEHYYPDSNRVTLQASDGRCLQGTWDYKAPHYCFYWENEAPACFRHARLGADVLIIETEDGHDTPMTQMMTSVSDTPVTCGVPPMS